MSVLAIHDPDALIRHRGIRVTIAMPTMFAVGVLALDNANIGLFGAFGAFALLAFADFGGEPWRRTRAYLVLVAIGAVLIALGTVASQQIVVGAILLAVLAFVIRLSSTFGGYYAAGGPAALLLFVVAVMVPAPPDEVLGREIGWILASVLSIVIVSVLWPVHERALIRRAAADVADGLAAVVRSTGTGPAAGGDAEEDADGGRRVRLEDLEARLTQLRDLYGRAGTRPAGPTERDQALVRLLDQLQRSVSFASRLRSLPAHDDGPPVDDSGLADAVARSVEHTAGVLRRTTDRELDTDLEGEREDHRLALEAWVGDALRRGAPSAVVVDRLRRTFPLRVLSHAALSCDGDAVLAVGGSLPADEDTVLLEMPRAVGSAAMARRTMMLLGSQLRVDSVAFRNAFRGAAALAVALVVANLVHAEHGFWVVLGTLTVLKSSAMRTGITALQALAGNVIGFVVAAAVMGLLGEQPTVLWVLLPIAVFLAAYAPAAIHFVVGQAAFTVLVVILFNILQPEGWRTGLVRVESVALGAAVSLVVGALFWPRGNRHALRVATASFYRDLATYLQAALTTMTRPAPGPTAASAIDDDLGTRRVARAAELRADEALFDLLTTPNVHTTVPAWARLTSVGRSLRLAGDGLWALSRRGLEPIVPGADQQALDALGTARVAQVAAIADRIDGHGEPGSDPVLAFAGNDGPGLIVSWLEHVDRADPGSVERTIAMTWSLEWIEVIAALAAMDDEPIRTVAAETDVPWWR